MKASDILDKVNNLRPNPYGSYLGDYLKSFDIRIREDLLCESGPTYDEENLALDYEYFTVYELFLFSVIDLLNGEYGRYENSHAAFEAEYSKLLTKKNASVDIPSKEPDESPKEPDERSFKIWQM